MTEVIDKIVPDFIIKTTDQVVGRLSDFNHQNIVLFFYPKDNTPVCTSEAKHFRDHFDQFTDLNTRIFGVSRDGLESHERFKKRLELPFELIADTSQELCNYFDVIGSKNFFGKKITGVIRSTFLIDQNRTLRQVWRKVKVTNHVQEVLKAIQELQS